MHFLIHFLLTMSFCGISPPQVQPLPMLADTCQIGKDTLTSRKIYLNADIGPACEGGPSAWLKHLNKTLNIREMPSGEIQSCYVIAFIVEKNGTASGERIINAPNNDITKQIFSAVRTIRWVPGKCKGKKVPMLYVLPITIDYASE
jgi:hypothetical protein